jgi:hypothetical protein
MAFDLNLANFRLMNLPSGLELHGNCTRSWISPFTINGCIALPRAPTGMARYFQTGTGRGVRGRTTWYSGFKTWLDD